MRSPTVEEVVLVDSAGMPTGTADKALVHDVDTPLHLAFSCHLFDGDGRILLTRRALTKQTWPGVWTNSFCGHPAPGESLPGALHRRAAEELGAVVCGIRSAVPEFRYRATDASGIVENEVCPVFVAELDGELDPSPDEVAEWRWTDPEALCAAVAAAPFAFSPWLGEQLPLLREGGWLTQGGSAWTG